MTDRKDESLTFVFLGAALNTWNKNLVSGLRREGHTVHHMHTSHGPDRSDIVETRTTEFFPVFMVWYLILAVFKNLMLLKKVILRPIQMKNADVLFLGHFGTPVFPVASIVSWVSGKPLMYACHLTNTITLLRDRKTFEKGSMGYKFIYWLDYVVHKLSDKVIVVTEAARDEISSLFDLSPSKYSVVYPGFNEENFKRGSVESEGFEEKDVDIVHWGNFLLHHGMETIIRAAEILDDLNFAIIGEGDQREEIINYAQDRELDNVSFPGYVEYNELEEYIRSADLVLGTFGGGTHNDISIEIKVVEACYFSKPVITAIGRGRKEIFEDGESILFVPSENPGALAEKINEVIGREEKLEDIGKNARKVYDKNMSPEINADKLISCYREIKKEKISESS